MTCSDDREVDSTAEENPTLDRRTALAGLFGVAGVAGGGVLGYRTFLADDEPAFAFDSDFQLDAEDLTIETVDGVVDSIELNLDGTNVELSWINFPPSEFEDEGDNLEDEFDVTLSLEKDGEEEELHDFSIDLEDSGENLPHNDEGQVTSLTDADVSGTDVDLTNHDSISNDYGEFEPDDENDEETTVLSFIIEVESTTLRDSDTDYETDEYSAESSVDLEVTVTDEDAEISVGGNIELEGEAEAEAYDDGDDDA